MQETKHFEFYGVDTYFKEDKAMSYLVSLPWSKVKANEAMLAREMNGEPLPAIHGQPLRIVDFGYIGAHVKSSVPPDGGRNFRDYWLSFIYSYF